MEGIDETIAPLIEAMNKVPYATGKTPEQCRAGLDEGIAFLTDYFRNIV